MLALACEAFSAWSHDPAESVAKMLHRGATSAAATIDGNLAGFAIVHFSELNRPMGPWSNPRIARLEAIASAKRWRKHGVGSTLLDWAEDEAGRQGAVVLRLLTAESNRAARRLFSNAGFMGALRSPSAYANGDAGIEMFKAIGVPGA